MGLSKAVELLYRPNHTGKAREYYGNTTAREHAPLLQADPLLQAGKTREHAPLLVTLANKEEKATVPQSLFDAAVESIHANKGFSAADLRNPSSKALIGAVDGVLKEAVSAGIESLGFEVPEAVTNTLRNSTWVFSGMKEYHALKEASLLLTNEDGTIKPLNEFKQEVLQIHQRYNERYLEAEYGYATHASLMAGKWKHFEADGAGYNLQYRTAADGLVREEHRVLEGTTLPMDDPFWKQYIPPLDWGCRCTVVQVLKEDYEVSDSDRSAERGEAATTNIGADGSNKLAMFRTNPGITLKVFPDKHPYMARKSSPEEVKEAQKTTEILAKKNAFKKFQDEARAALKGVTVNNEQFGKTIKFSGNGVREFLNQPHEHYEAKNRLIMDIPEILKKSTYKGWKYYTPKNGITISSHYFEIAINGDTSFLIVNEYNKDNYIFYSISDSKTLANGAKK